MKPFKQYEFCLACERLFVNTDLSQCSSCGILTCENCIATATSAQNSSPMPPEERLCKMCYDCFQDNLRGPAQPIRARIHRSPISQQESNERSHLSLSFGLEKSIHRLNPVIRRRFGAVKERRNVKISKSRKESKYSDAHDRVASITLDQLLGDTDSAVASMCLLVVVSVLWLSVFILGGAYLAYYYEKN